MRYVFSGDTQTMLKLRKIFVRIADECDIEIGRFETIVFLKKLVAALIEAGVFVKVEEGDQSEDTR